MKKKGFTLVELLTTIVIISIIALIAIPVTNSIIFSTKKAGFYNDAKSLVKFVQLDRENNGFVEMDEKMEYVISSSNNNITYDSIPLDVDFEGNITGNGIIYVDKDGNVALAYTNNSFCAYKDYSDGDISVKTGNCDNIDILRCNQSSLVTSIEPSDWTQYKYLSLSYDYSSSCNALYYRFSGESDYSLYDGALLIDDNSTIEIKLTSSLTGNAEFDINVPNIDRTAPTNVSFTYTRDVNGLVITALATDAQSGIYGFEFSVNGGTTWSEMQTTGSTSTEPQTKTYTYGISDGYSASGTYQLMVRATNNAWYNTPDEYKVDQLGITTNNGSNACQLPSFDVSPTGTTWAQEKTVTITSPSGYTTKYTTDGTDPVTNGTEGTSVTISSIGTTTVVAAAINDGNACKVSQAVSNIDRTAPTALGFTYVRDNTSIKVTATATDAESGIYGFRFSSDNGNTWSEVKTTGSTSTSAVTKEYTFTGLTSTGSYTIKVQAINNAYQNTTGTKNDSLGITTSNGVSACALPSFDVSPTGTTWAQEKTVTITSPSGYTTKYTTNGTDPVTNGTEGTSVTITSTGTTTVVAAAIKDGNACKASQAVSNIDRTAPTNVSYTYTRDGTSIEVTATATDAQSGIYGFKFSSDNGNTWTAVKTTGSTSTSAVSKTHTFTGLTSTGSYTIKVQAINNAYQNTTGTKNDSLGITTSSGSGACALPSFNVSPSGTTWAQEKTVTITSPSGYTTKYTTNGTDPVTNGTTGTSVTITSTGTTTVVAAAIRDGNACKASQAVSNIDRTAPTSVSFTYTRDGTSMTITATGTDAQSGIYGFKFSSDNGNTWSEVKTTGSTSTSAVSKAHTFTGLTATTDYTVKVQAINNAYQNTTGTKSDSLGITTSSAQVVKGEFPIGQRVIWGGQAWYVVGKGDYPVPNAAGTANSGTAKAYVLLYESTSLTKIAHYSTSTTYSWGTSAVRAAIVDTSTGYPKNSTFNSLRSEMIPTLICKDNSLKTTTTKKAVTYGGATKYEIDQISGSSCSSGYANDYVRLLTASEYYNLTYRTGAVTSASTRTSVPYIPIAVISYMPTKIASSNSWFYPSTDSLTTTAYSGTATASASRATVLYNNSEIFTYVASTGKTYIYRPVVAVKFDSSARKPNSYTITFNSNGGSAVASQTVAERKTATKPTDPTKSGYLFDGWYTDSGLTTTYNFSSAVTSNKTLYAKWATAYTVTFNSNGGSAVASQTVKTGTTATKPTDPTKSGYIFDGWYSDSTLKTAYDFSTAVTSNKTLYAKWATAYTVTFNSREGSSVASQTVKSGDKATKPSDPTRSGYEFDSWRLGPSSSYSVYNFDTAVTSDKTLYAIWKQTLSCTAYGTSMASCPSSGCPSTSTICPSSTSCSCTVNGETVSGTCTSLYQYSCPNNSYCNCKFSNTISQTKYY